MLILIYYTTFSGKNIALFEQNESLLNVAKESLSPDPLTYLLIFNLLINAS